MGRTKWWRNHLGFELVLLVLLCTGVYLFLSAPPARAACSYPARDCGYFFARTEPEPYDFVFACGLFDGNVGTFETDIINYANGKSIPGGCAPNLGVPQYEAGAAFIILTMLGDGPGTPKSDARKASVQADWLSRVNYYNSQGWIDFSYHIRASDGCRNTAYQITSPDVAQLPDCQIGASAIKFQVNNSGGTYIIKQICGNPYGVLSPLRPPVTYACGQAKVDPALLQPGTDMSSVTVNDTYTNGPPVYKDMYLNISTIPYTVHGNGVNDSGSSLSYVAKPPPNLPAPSPAGFYNNVITWYLEDSSGNRVGPTCHGDITTVDLPYFNVTHGDVEAGGNFEPAAGGSCTPTGAGIIGAWYDSSNANNGANTLFAAIALGQITGFASRQGGANPDPPPMGLSFANTSAEVDSIDSPSLGGKYGGGTTVTTNCFYDASAPGSSTGIGGSFTVNGGDDGAYSGTGPLKLNGGTVGVGKNVTVFVKNGNVEITSNGNGGIDFAGSGGGWSLNPDDTTNIPSFVLDVTGGDIFIDPNVTNLDGVYVAQASGGNGGKIYTCANAGGPIKSANLYAQCNDQLVVHGSFIADQVNLMRTLGTLNQAAKTNIKCQNGAAVTPTCASQAFDFDPEVYLGSPAVAPPNSGSPQYDSISSLPPVL